MLTLADLRRRARSRLFDLRQDYLWSDEELLDCINDALRDAAIRANFVVQDDYAIPFELDAPSTTAYKAKYPIPSSTLDVRAVYLASQPSYTLQRTSYRRLDQRQQYRPNASQKGAPWAYALDQTMTGVGEDYYLQSRAITFIDTPSAADTAYLDLVRLPALLEQDEDVPEIDEIWHPYLIYGVTGFAFLKRDSDTFDQKSAERDAAMFAEAFGDRLPAVTLRDRQTDVPREMILG